MISSQTQCPVEFSANFLHYFGYILQGILLSSMSSSCFFTYPCTLSKAAPRDFSSCLSLVADLSNAFILFFCPWSFIFSSGCRVNSPQKNTDSHFSIWKLGTVWFFLMAITALLAGKANFRSSLFDSSVTIFQHFSFFSCFDKFSFTAWRFPSMNLSPGDNNFRLIVGRETLASRCDHSAPCPTLVSPTLRTVFLPCWRFRSWTFLWGWGELSLRS